MKKVFGIIIVLALAIILGAGIDEFRDSGVSLATVYVNSDLTSAHLPSVGAEVIL